MSYEIPPALQYKEKIFLGLDVEQIAYLAIAFLLLLPIIKSDLELAWIIVSAIPICGIAIFFMYFRGRMWIKRILRFMKFKHATVQSESMEQFIGVTKVAENKVATRFGTVAIVEVHSLNFSVNNKNEKESIILRFEKLLNAIDFPIQFVVNSTQLNLHSYFRKTAKSINETYRELFNQQKNFLYKTIRTDQVKNKRFYLVIKEQGNLDLQVQVVLKKLTALGLQPRRLKTKELLKTLHLFFNANQKGTKNREADKVAHLLCPNEIINHRKYLEVNKKCFQVVTAVGYPHRVEWGFLDRIISGNDNYDVSIHMEPYSLDIALLQLNRELQKQRTDQFAQQQKSMLNPSLEIQIKATRRVLEQLQQGQEKLFMVSLYILCKGKNKEEMELLTAKVKAELQSLLIRPEVPSFAMADGYRSTMPLGHNSLGQKRNITTKALAAFFPFSSPFLSPKLHGLVLGLNKNKIPLIKDVFSHYNANGFILASSGAGKSYATKLWLLRHVINNTKVIIIDPQGEYTAVTQKAEGQVITISKDSATIINPLDLMGHDYINKRLSLMQLFDIMFQDLTVIQKAILDKAIQRTYTAKKITIDSWKGKKAPKLSDLYRHLQILANKASRREQMTYTALLNRLSMYIKGGVFGFLDKQTNIDFSNKWVCFNINQMPKQVQPVMMFLILDYIYTTMQQDKEKKILAVDEAWSLLSRAKEESYLFGIVKTCRKFNMGMLLITQDVDDLLSSKAGRALLNNSSYHLLLKQNAAAIDAVAHTFKLSKHERETLLTASPGKGILTLPKEHQEISIIASPQEHEVITTNPNEPEKQAVVEESDEEDIAYDTDELVHLAQDKDIDEENYFLEHGYAKKFMHGLKRGKQKYYFIKKIGNESLEHTCMIGLAVQEIKKYTGAVAAYHTDKPDIIFTNKNGQEIALEIETGFKTKKDAAYLQKKFADLKKQYGKRVYIILLDSNKRHFYKKLGVPFVNRFEVKWLLHLHFSEDENSIIVQKCHSKKSKSSSVSQKEPSETRNITRKDHTQSITGKGVNYGSSSI